MEGANDVAMEPWRKALENKHGTGKQKLQFMPFLLPMHVLLLSECPLPSGRQGTRRAATVQGGTGKRESNTWAQRYRAGPVEWKEKSVRERKQHVQTLGGETA